MSNDGERKNNPQTTHSAMSTAVARPLASRPPVAPLLLWWRMMLALPSLAAAAASPRDSGGGAPLPLALAAPVVGETDALALTLVLLAVAAGAMAAPREGEAMAPMAGDVIPPPDADDAVMAAGGWNPSPSRYPGSASRGPWYTTEPCGGAESKMNGTPHEEGKWRTNWSA